MLSVGSSGSTNFNNHLHSPPIDQGASNIKLAFLSTVVESSEDAFFTKDLNDIITGWNPAAEKIYGFSAKEAVGQSIAIIFPPEQKEELSEIMVKIQKGIKIDRLETVRQRKDGKEIHILLSIFPVKDSRGKVIGSAGIARDLSENIELEKSKDDFISIASHELKTPLTTLKGFSQILVHYSDRLDPQLLSFISRMSEQVDKLNILINDLLDASHIKLDKIKLRRQRFKIDELIFEVGKDMQKHTRQHQIVLKLNANCSLKADKHRLNQVLINLISNAIKYSPHGQSIIIKSRSTPKLIEVSIEDFGIGIFPKDKKKIFERFYQAKNKIRESFSGLGLGLYICAEIIRQHQGEIEVESKKGVGSTFRFQIPRL